MNTIGERLKHFIKSNQYSIKEYSLYAGIKPSTINDYVNNYASPGAESLTKFAETGLNINWLLTGNGEMLISESNLIQEKAEKILAETKFIIEKELGVKL